MTSREPRVLILSEDALFRSVLMRQFEKEGWEVEESSRPEDAERRSVQFLPHVAVVSTPKVQETVALLKHWKTLPTLTRTRVIVETSELLPGEAEALLKAGAATVALRGHQTPADIARRAGKELP